MEFQTTQLINGEWTTRTATLDEVLARNCQQQTAAKQPRGFKNQYQPPQMGVLTKTLFRSPIVQFILPARIRGEKQNDVIFVGEDYVQIKSIHNYGHLHHVATKADFRGRILAARIFGEPREDIVERASMEQEDSASKAPFPPQVLVLTLDTGALMFLWALSEETGAVRFHQRTVPFLDAGSPLTLQGVHLAVDPNQRAIAVSAFQGSFVIYRTKSVSEWSEDILAGDSVTPIVEERSFMIEGSIQHMEFLSPSSTEKDENHVILIFVHRYRKRTRVSCYDWDHRGGLRTVNVRAERVGVDFEDQFPSLLIPLKRGPNFLLVSERSISNYKNILSGSFTRYRVRLGHDEMLIHPGISKSPPLFVAWERMLRNPGYPKEALYIAREDGIVIYAQIGEGASTSNVGHFNCSLGTAFSSLDVPPQVGRMSFQKGYRENADVLIGIGPDSDGQLNKVGSWAADSKPSKNFGSFDFVETIPNWAPISDSLISRLPGLQTGYERHRDSVFVANGREPYGAVSELRRGLKALVHRFVDLPNITAGATGVWVVGYWLDEVDSETTLRVLLLICLPPRSYLFRLSGSQDGDFDEVEELDEGSMGWEDGVDRENETLSACLLKRGKDLTKGEQTVSVQVTRCAISLLRHSQDALPCIDKYQFASPIIAATTMHKWPLVVVAMRQGTSVTLRVIPFTPAPRNGKHFNAHMDFALPADPTCLELVEIDEAPHLLVGTRDFFVCLFSIDTDGLSLVMREQFRNHVSASLSAGCESAVVLHGPSDHIVVCGMRNGELLILGIDASDDSSSDEGEVTVESKRVVRMGTTPAKVTKCDTDPSTAFVTCGSDLCRIQYSGNEQARLKIDSVWFTDRNMPGYQQSAVSTLTQLPRSYGPISGFIFSILGSRLLVAQFDFDVWRPVANKQDHLSRELSKAIPRKLETGYTPTKIFYSANTRVMVVAAKHTYEMSGPPDGYRGICCSLQFLRLDDDTIENDIKVEDEEGQNGNKLIAYEHELGQYERVWSIQEWTYANPTDGKKHGFIIVGTGKEGRSPGGRRLFFNVRRSSKAGSRGVPEVKLKKEEQYPHPIYSMALYEENTLVFTSGNELCLERYDYNSSKWLRRGSVTMRALGVHVSASPPFVHVSMSENSHICYEVVEDAEQPGKVKFKIVFTDSVTRECTSHLLVKLPPADQVQEGVAEAGPVQPSSPSSEPGTQAPTTIVLVADKRCSLAGIYHPPVRTSQTSAPTVFEATLGRCITRLHRGNIRPPWRRPAQVNQRGSPNSSPSFSSEEPKLPGVLVDDIIGTCTEGTVFAISMLTAPASKLLKLVENIITLRKAKANTHHTPEYPLEDKKKLAALLDHDHDSASDKSQNKLISVGDVELKSNDRGPGKARKWHINGDTIAEWMDENEKLSDLARDRTEREVVERVLALGKEVLGDMDTQMSGSESVGGEGGEEALLARIEEWVRDVGMEVL